MIRRFACRNGREPEHWRRCYKGVYLGQVRVGTNDQKLQICLLANGELLQGSRSGRMAQVRNVPKGPRAQGTGMAKLSRRRFLHLTTIAAAQTLSGACGVLTVLNGARRVKPKAIARSDRAGRTA
jgi:hypothetical protein